MKINSESIYGTKQWLISSGGPNEIQVNGTTSSEKPWFNADFTPKNLWFTSKNNVVYVTAFQTERKGKMHIKALAKGNLQTDHLKVRNVTVLGSKNSLKSKQNKNSMVIQLPESVHPDEGCVIKIEFH